LLKKAKSIETVPDFRNLFALQLAEGKINSYGNFLGSPKVKTLRFHCRGYRFDPWLVN